MLMTSYPELAEADKRFLAFKRSLKPHPLNIPAFLLITPSERRAWWEHNPPQAMPRDAFIPRKYEPSPEIEEERRQQSLRKIDKMKNRLAAKQASLETRAAIRSGMRWDPRKGKFVPDGVPQMSRPPFTREQIEAGIKEPLAKNPAPSAPRVVAVKHVDDLGARVSEHCGGDAAKLKAFARANGVWDDKYASLNPGLQRMNVVNRLRGKVKKDSNFKVKW